MVIDHAQLGLTDQSVVDETHLSHAQIGLTETCHNCGQRSCPNRSDRSLRGHKKDPNRSTDQASVNVQSHVQIGQQRHATFVVLEQNKLGGCNDIPRKLPKHWTHVFQLMLMKLTRTCLGQPTAATEPELSSMALLPAQAT